MSEDGSASGVEKEDPKKQKARELWDRLAKSRPGPDNKDLIFLARFVPLLSSAALKTLLKRKLTLDELKELIQHAPKARDAATKLALNLDPDDVTEEDLRFIFTQTKSVDVAKLLLKRYPHDANLAFVERTVEGMKDLVEEIRKKETTSAVLKEIDRRL